jgi:hypothetical protein
MKRANKITSSESYNNYSYLNTDKFQDVRTKLDKFRYKYHLDLSSVELADAMVTDIHKFAQENLKHTDENSKLKSELENSQISLKAFKAENSRLIKENNEIHRELLQIKTNHSSSNISKTLEVKRLVEEKNDFKYMYINSKHKLETLHRENEELKHRITLMLNRIYEGNMSESSLRKMFNYDDNIRVLNEEIEKHLDLGIHIKPRGITTNININLENEFHQLPINNEESLSLKKNCLKDIIEKTFKNFDNSTKIEKSEKIPEEIISLETISGGPFNSNTLNFGTSKKYSTIDLEFYEEKLKVLQDDIRMKDSELSRLQRLLKNETTPNEGSEMIITFLKKDIGNIKEKYEHRIDTIIKENKIYENRITEMNNKIKHFENHHPYILELQKKLKIFEDKNLSLQEEISKFRNESKILNLENANLQLKFKDLKENYVEKILVSFNEEKFNKLSKEYTSNQDLISKLDQRIIELTANYNTNERSLNSEIKTLNCQVEDLKLEIEIIKRENNKLEMEKEELKQNINLIQMNIMKKNNTVNEFQEKLEGISSDRLILEKEKINLNLIISELEEKIHILKKELIVKENEIERINNLNLIFQKQIEFFESK